MLERRRKQQRVFSSKELDVAAQLLKAYHEGNSQLSFLTEGGTSEPQRRFETALRNAYKYKQSAFRKERTQKRRAATETTQKADYEILSETGIRERRKVETLKARIFKTTRGAGTMSLSSPLFRLREPTSEFMEKELQTPNTCYICKIKYTLVHHFYDSLCPKCAQENHTKRLQTADLSGKIAIVTGGRIKIGFEVALKLLSAGATVLVTTRFPKDCHERFCRQSEAGEWLHRLKIYRVDLRFFDSLTQFLHHVHEDCTHIDIVINNASQTVRRKPEFYSSLHKTEQSNVKADNIIIENMLPVEKAAHAQAVVQQESTLGKVYQVEAQTSWTKKLGDIGVGELFEVTMINSISPFILIENVKPLMSGEDPTFIVNVSTMEGKFNWSSKNSTHPHTNMTRAALNMMTQSMAPELEKKNIHMVAVDAGWTTDEIPAIFHTARDRFDDVFHPPLDDVDGSARILDPVFSCVCGCHPVSAVFLKDYCPTSW